MRLWARDLRKQRHLFGLCMRTLLGIIRPFASIARELRTLRELFELELASRNPPVIRHTERARKSDTEVSYMGVQESVPGYKRWFTAAEESDMEDDVQS